MSSHFEKHSDSFFLCRRTRRALWRSEGDSFQWCLRNRWNRQKDVTLNLNCIFVYIVRHALTKVLAMSPLICIDEEEGVTRQDETSAIRAVGDMDALTVPGYHETVSTTWTTSAWQPWRTLLAWISSSAIWTYREKKHTFTEDHRHL